MKESVSELHEQRMLDLAREYEGKGYKVVLQPNGSALPEFLHGLQPDLLAYGEDESVVVEVRSRTTLRSTGEEDLREFADRVDSAPGWRLELVVANPDDSSPIVQDGAREPDAKGIRERAVRALRLLDAGQADAAALLAWSAAEATLRRLADKSGVALESHRPAAIVKQLYVLGELDRAEYELLVAGVRLRNTLAHGFESPTPERAVVVGLTQWVRDAETTS